MSSFVRGHRRGLIAAAVVVVLVAGGAVAGYLTLRSTGRSVTVPGDQIGCVYSSVESGHKFIRSIQPGERVTVGKTDELVQLPRTTSSTTSRAATRSPEAPQPCSPTPKARSVSTSRVS